MAVPFNDNIRYTSPKPGDDRYFQRQSGLTPWGSPQQVNENIPRHHRHIGLTVNIMGVEWWYEFGVNDSDLVQKQTGGGGGGTGGVDIQMYNTFNDLPTNANEGDIAGVQYNINAASLPDEQVGGLYRFLSGSWRRMGNIIDLFIDNRFRIFRKGSGGVINKTVKFNLDNVTVNSGNVELFIPNKSGTLATLDDITVADSKRSNIFIVNVEKTTTNGTVGVDYINTGVSGTNNNVVERITTDEDVVRVEIEWDRNFEFRGTPKINGADITPVTSVVKQGGSYRTKVDVNISAVNEITCTYADSSYVVDIVKVEAPIIQSVVIGDYPGTQSSFKENDNISITITADKPFNRLVVLNSGLSKAKTETFSLRTTHTTTLSAANRGENNIERAITLYVEDNNGRSDNFITETKFLNNLVPRITNISYIYENGSALKDSEQVTINIATTNTTEHQVNLLSVGGITQLQEVSKTGNTYVLSRNGGNYNENTNNLTFTLTNNDNGRVNTVSSTTTGQTFVVRIAHVAPIINAHTPINVRSGVGNVIIPSSFNQTVIVDGVSLETSNKGVLSGSASSSSFSTSFETTITASDSDIHNNDTVNMELTIRNRADKTAVVNRTYKVRGFAEKTLTGQDISQPVLITPDITDIGKVIVFVGDNTSLTPCIFTTPSVVEPLFTDSSQDDQFHAYLSEGSWFLIFNTVVGAKAQQAGWLQNARITIQETV